MVYRKRRPPVTLICPWCARGFTRLAYYVRVKARRNRGKVFCSAKCGYAFRWNGSRKVSVSCLNCGSKRTVQLARATRRNGRFFCSRACFGSWKSMNLIGPKSGAWKGGKTYSYVGCAWKKTRVAVRERDAYRCRYCGVRHRKNQRNFDVHHIKPYGEFSDKWKANRMSNLATICRKCHGKFNPNYRGRRPKIIPLNKLG